MAKYTTEVRHICESLAGKTESVGFKEVDNILSSSWNKIFTSTVSFFDEAYRPVLCKKILKHYYMREIGAETVGLWQLWLNTRLEEIMPYYNQLYESETLKFDPLMDYDVERTHTKTGKDTKQETGSSETERSDTREMSGTQDRSISGKEDSASDSDYTTSNTHWDLYSDTPQGGVSGIENENYLTNARKITDSGSGNTTGRANSTSSETDKTISSQNDSSSGNTNVSTTSGGTYDSTEDYLEKVSGKTSGGSYSDMLLKFRETFLNIDAMVIEEFEDLFMGLW